MAALVVETPPVAQPVALDVLKNHLKVSVEDDDTLIGDMYLPSATVTVETFLSRSLINKGYRQSLDRFPHRFHDVSRAMGAFGGMRNDLHYRRHPQTIKLLVSPVVRVDRLSYLGTDQLSHDLFPAAEPWQADTVYRIGARVVDPNGNLQTVTAIDESQENEDGTVSSDSNTPTWAAAEGDPTTDGALTWTNGAAAPAADFIVDLDSEPARIYPPFAQYWPLELYAPNAVQIHFTAGYGNDGDACPPAAKLAILMLVGSWYVNREAVSPMDLREIPHHIENLLWNDRVLDYSPTPG